MKPEDFNLQYEQLSEGLRSRDSMTILAGSILITASIVLLTQAFSRPTFLEKVSIVAASLSIYIIWLIGFNLTTKKLNSMYFARLRSMEKNRSIKIHTRNIGEVRDTLWWRVFRQNIWLLLLWVLIFLSVSILEI